MRNCLAQTCRRDVDVEDVHDGSAEANRVAESNGQRSPTDTHSHVGAHESAPVCDRRGRARTGAARLGLPGAALPDAHGECVDVGDGDEFHIGPARKPGITAFCRNSLYCSESLDSMRSLGISTTTFFVAGPDSSIFIWY